MSTVDLSKYKKIINKLRELGFDFHQAGTISKYHELNLVIENMSQDRQYWIVKSFGEFYISYRNGIHDIKAKQYRFECKSQQEACNKFAELVSQ